MPDITQLVDNAMSKIPSLTLAWANLTSGEPPTEVLELAQDLEMELARLRRAVIIADDEPTVDFTSAAAAAVSQEEVELTNELNAKATFSLPEELDAVLAVQISHDEDDRRIADDLRALDGARVKIRWDAAGHLATVNLDGPIQALLEEIDPYGEDAAPLRSTTL